MTPSLGDQGFWGYAYAEDSNLSLSLFSPNVTRAEANRTWDPFFDHARSQAESGGFTITNYTVFPKSFTDRYEPLYGEGDPVGVNILVTSQGCHSG